MKSRYAAPRDLIEALHSRAPGARDRLWEELRQPLGRLVDQLIARHGLDGGRERLTLHALHSAETYLRTRPVREFERLSWTAFRSAVLLHIARMAFHPFGGQAGTTAGPAPLPDSPAYLSQTYFLPHDRIGAFWFGGDWYAGRHTSDGALWVLVADVTGHGYYAYLLASALPGVWQACWKAAGPDVQPHELLTAMHHLLEECLPEGVFVECTLVRLNSEGEATVSPAGGTRLLLRRGDGRPDLHKLRGAWLGLLPPTAEEQRSWTLQEGDELLLGSDGAFDQLAEHGAAPDQVRRSGRNLLDDVQQLLGQALRQGPQQDDITLVLLRRRASEAEGAAVLPFPGPSFRKGADDVPV